MLGKATGVEVFGSAQISVTTMQRYKRYDGWGHQISTQKNGGIAAYVFPICVNNK